MKKLKKLTLGEGMRVLSNPELKNLKGGGYFYHCHCKNNSGEGVPANNCKDCETLCGSISNIQNCTYING